MPSIILAAPGVPGELTPILELARDLVGRGHAVVVLTAARCESSVLDTGARFEPFGGATHLAEEEDLRRVMAEGDSLAPGPEQLNHQWSRVFADPIADQHAALQRVLEREPDSVLITNSVFLGAWPIGLGAPGHRPRRWIAIGANPLAVSSIDTTPFGPVPAEPGGDEHSGNRTVNAGLAAATEPTRRHIEAILRSLGATEPVPSFLDGIATVPDLFASLSVAPFDFPRSDLPSTVRYVGILGPRASHSWVAPPWWSDLDGDRPVIAVTQGTAANRDLTELIEPTLQALADRDAVVVATTGRETDAIAIPVPDNARVASFVPFDRLLPRCSVLVTNGGFGGTQHALACGVPVVIAGTTEDKPMTGARVAFHGLGVNLDSSSPGRARIAGAVDEVLHDATIAANVERIARVYAAHDARREIAELALGEASSDGRAPVGCTSASV